MTVFKVNNRPVVKTWNGIVSGLFSDFENNFGDALPSQVPVKAPVNITESERAYNLELAAPGRTKELFSLNVEQNVLTIGYEDKKEPETKDLKTIRNEFLITSFKRNFTLDEKIDAGAIEAKYENGVLKVTLPKKAAIKPEIKQISIQ